MSRELERRVAADADAIGSELGQIAVFLRDAGPFKLTQDLRDRWSAVERANGGRSIRELCADNGLELDRLRLASVLGSRWTQGIVKCPRCHFWQAFTERTTFGHLCVAKRCSESFDVPQLLLTAEVWPMPPAMGFDGLCEVAQFANRHRWFVPALRLRQSAGRRGVRVRRR